MALCKICKAVLLLLLATSALAQNTSWTANEVKFHKTVQTLVQHFKDKPYDTTDRAFVFDKFVEFDYVLNDTAQERKQTRLRKFDALFYRFRYFIDSVGAENLGAKPMRFFAADTVLFEPFAQGRELAELLPDTFAYFDKRQPTVPRGVLLFDAATHKLLSWILINQGGYYYFLIFNLL